MMLNLDTKGQKYWNDPKNLMNISGWKHFYEFYAFPDDLKISGIEYDLEKALVVKQKP